VQPQNTFPEVIGNLGNLMKSGAPENFTTTSVFNTGVVGPTTSLPAGTVVSGLNTAGGSGNQSFTIGAGGGALFGNLGRNIAQARGPFQQNWDFFLTKKFPLTEKYNLHLRAEFFNIFNHPNFAITNTDIGSPAFGIYSSTVGNPRILQLALKFQF
jgi:hypothetical protein